MSFALRASFLSFFFFNDTATTEIYTLSLHDALPILYVSWIFVAGLLVRAVAERLVLGESARADVDWQFGPLRSEEHTSELQSHLNIVCRLLLEKKKSQPPRPRFRPHPRLVHRTSRHL